MLSEKVTTGCDFGGVTPSLNQKKAGNLPLSLLRRAGVQTERSVQRAETDEAGGDENAGQYEKNNTQRAGNRSGEVQHSYRRCNDDADQAIHRTHILFHGKVNFG